MRAEPRPRTARAEPWPSPAPTSPGELSTMPDEPWPNTRRVATLAHERWKRHPRGGRRDVHHASRNSAEHCASRTWAAHCANRDWEPSTGRAEPWSSTGRAAPWHTGAGNGVLAYSSDPQGRAASTGRSHHPPILPTPPHRTESPQQLRRRLASFTGLPQLLDMPVSAIVSREQLIAQREGPRGQPREGGSLVVTTPPVLINHAEMVQASCSATTGP